jgi:O-antigen ligase
VGVLAFFTSALYWPGTLSPVIAPRLALLALVIPWLLREQRLTAAHVAGLAFLAWAAVTMFWAASPLDGIGAMLTLFILAVCFCLGNQSANLRRVYIGAGLALWLSSAIAIAQYLGFRPLPSVTPISGLFVNGNFMAEAAALVIVAAVVERIWWLIPGLLPALVLSGSRGAMLACVLALAIHFRAHWRITLPVLALAAIGLVAHAYQFGDSSSVERLQIWHSAINGVSLFGHGIGSFWSSFPSFDLRPTAFTHPEHAHNEFLNVAFELGLVGLVLLCGFCATLAGPLDTARLVLIALLVESIFEFPLHEPTTAFLGMVAAGHAVRNRYLLWDFVVGRRGIGAAWLARAKLPRGHAVAHSGRPLRAL